MSETILNILGTKIKTTWNQRQKPTEEKRERLLLVKLIEDRKFIIKQLQPNAYAYHDKEKDVLNQRLASQGFCCCPPADREKKW